MLVVNVKLKRLVNELKGNPTGILRSFDNLGRFVIPKEIRDMKRWNTDTKLTIIPYEDGVFIKKYENDKTKEVLLKQLRNIKPKDSELESILWEVINFLESK